jgi:2-polyprenyl-3-methyl-5-hydroxy-6-metoxy-1,4-benzoquinol methylase
MKESISKHTWEEAVQWLRNQQDKQGFVKDCYYDDPIAEAAERFYQSAEYVAIKDLLPALKGKKILEIGAGRGIVSYAFAKDGADVYALEPDNSPLVGFGALQELIETSGVAFNIVSEWGEKLPFKTEEFDIIFCRCVLHHAYDLPAMCKEIARVLKKGGTFLAEREHVLSKKEDLQIFLANHLLHHLYGGENAFLLTEYQDALRNGGLTIQKTIAPFSHEINILPYGNHPKKSAVLALNKIFPLLIAKKLAKVTFIYKAYVAYINYKSQTPGRFYSFLCTKL